MGISRTVLRSAKDSLSRSFQNPLLIRNFSAKPFSGGDYKQNSDSSGSVNDNFPILGSFYKKLDKVERSAHDRLGLGSSFNPGNRPGFLDGLNDSYDTLTDGLDLKLKKAATYFEFDPDEVTKEDYAFRPDVNFSAGMTYDTKDLDLGRPGVRKPVKRAEFETSTEEVLAKADFRNVRFLANFITEAGIIIKRSKTGISAKAQRKVAREIKTARAFGLMPFTTMGTKSFKVGTTMEDQDEDFGYEINDYNFVDERV